MSEAACAGFSCGANDIDKYFTGSALKYHARNTHRVTCAHLKGNDHAAGFVALASVTEKVSVLKGHYHPFGGADRFPCLQLVWLGVQKPLQRQGVGTRLVGLAIDIFARVGSEIGLPHLILVPLNEDVKEFYRSLGFQEYDKGSKMFLPLQSAMDAIGLE